MPKPPEPRHERIPLALIDIGTDQVRTDLSRGVDDLVASIPVQGLLQPIIVKENAAGRYDLLAGQRRFLAHQELGLSEIRAYVFDKEAKVDARVISLTENLVRLDNTQKELIDRCTALYKQYGNMAIVAQETGLRPSVVSQYVKYDQLIPLLKQKVDAVQLDMKVALQAQKAATASNGEVDEEAAAKFAEELAPMSNLQRKTFVESVTADPTASLEERIEKGKRSRTLKMITVTLEESLHKGLQDYAKGSECSQDEAAADLIEDGLTRRGLLTKE